MDIIDVYRGHLWEITKASQRALSRLDNGEDIDEELDLLDNSLEDLTAAMVEYKCNVEDSDNDGEPRLDYPPVPW